jgi:hypothetical protein
MKTNTEIKITTDTSLVKYTHCSTLHAATNLRDDIVALESARYAVMSATGSRSAVPNKYKSAYKIHAPFYIFRGGDREIELIDGKLQNRSNGSTIPAHFEIAGSEVPEGFRCFRRNEETIEIRRK